MNSNEIVVVVNVLQSKLESIEQVNKSYIEELTRLRDELRQSQGSGEATVVAQVEVAAADGSGSAAVSAGVAAPDAPAVAATACPWYAYDTDNGLRYYYNATTEESAWQLPDGFVEVRSSQGHWLRPLLMR